MTLEREDIVRIAKGNRTRIRHATAQLADITYTPISDFDSDPDDLNVKNGVINLRSGQLRPRAKDDYFTYCLPVDYDPTADQSAWLKFLHDAVNGDPELMGFLQMAVGYSATGRTNEECLFYVHGPARSGKGTFTETLLRLFGSPLSLGIKFETLTRDRSGDANSADLATLRPCRLVTASESSRNTALNPAVVKSITGGDDIFCAMKYRDHFSYRPRYKLWLTSNWPLNIDYLDDAAWHRVHVIEFPNSHSNHEDKGLKERLKQPANLRGVLAWIVEGAVRWYESDKGLIVPDSVKLTKEKHRAELDTVQIFVDECLREATGYRVSYGQLYAEYTYWCERNGISPLGHRMLNKALEARGYERGKGQVDGKNQRIWKNIEIV